MLNLNVNIDHLATLRNARGENSPDVIYMAQAAEHAGAAGIVTHLRKDRRHIKDQDVINIKNSITTHLNLEMSVDNSIVEFACKVKPAVATIVPEENNELTTEGGLDVVKNRATIEKITKTLQDKGIQVSLFIEPEEQQIEAASQIGANRVEFNTKYYAIACAENNFSKIEYEIRRHKHSANMALHNNLYLAAGHSLNYHNIRAFANAIDIMEYNIGHSIISRACIVGLHSAVKEMITTINNYKI